MKSCRWCSYKQLYKNWVKGLRPPFANRHWPKGPPKHCLAEDERAGMFALLNIVFRGLEGMDFL